MRLPSKKTVKTAVACAAGATVLLFPGSVLMLGVGAALGYWGGALSRQTEEVTTEQSEKRKGCFTQALDAFCGVAGVIDSARRGKRD